MNKCKHSLKDTFFWDALYFLEVYQTLFGLPQDIVHEDKDDIDSSKELEEEERKHAEAKQTDEKVALGIFDEDSRIYKENSGTGKCADPGITNGIPWCHWNSDLLRSSP